LRDEGYCVEVRAGHLLLHKVPYVTAARQVFFGTLVSVLFLDAERTVKPSDHVAYWAGDFPCDKDGAPIDRIRSSPGPRTIDNNLTTQHSFSSKPPGGYTDHYDKMTTYAKILSGPARALDPTVSPTPFPVVLPESDDSVFHYTDTASPRAGINGVTQKLKAERIAIVGIGGTGSYILDLLAKIPVREIRIFDGDRFKQHNAFRGPGPTSLSELNTPTSKVDLFHRRYSQMHRHIVPHNCYLDGTNVKLLHGVTFAFLCLDKGEPKRPIMAELEAMQVPFVDVGMGVTMVDESLIALVRVTACTNAKRDHVPKRVSFANTESDAYTQNIQLADLNMMNAALAVIKWKKLRGFYVDLEQELHSVYALDGNLLHNEDRLP